VTKGEKLEAQGKGNTNPGLLGFRDRLSGHGYPAQAEGLGYPHFWVVKGGKA
jgi:hypothetical protein